MDKKSNVTLLKPEEDHISLRVEIKKIGDIEDPSSAHLIKLEGQEHLGDIFHFRLQIAIKDLNLDPYKILGKFFSVKITNPDESYSRYFSGHIIRLAKTQHILAEHAIYTAELVPSAWFLTQNQNYRIYQGKNVIEIIEEVTGEFSGHKFFLKNLAKNPYQPFEYCVQHGESDWNFLSRMMEELGIYYYFDHQEDKNELVLCDAKNDHTHTEGFKNHKIELAKDKDPNLPENADKIYQFYPCHSVTPHEWSVFDYEFKNPQKMVESNTKEGADFGISVKSNHTLPIYGAKDGRIDTLDMPQWNLERDKDEEESYFANSCSMLIRVGHLFTFAEDEQDYLVTSVEHLIEAGLKIDISEEQQENTPAAGYGNSFVCVSADHQFRPDSKYDKAAISGVQTAIIVGESEGQDGKIVTDEYGRVKVRFHWDINNTKKEQNTAWLRVMQPSAGKNTGHADIPRVGEEVVISFINGDPDRPIIIGSIYNGDYKAEIMHTEQPAPAGHQLTNVSDGQAFKAWKMHKSINGSNTDINGDVFHLELGKELHTTYDNKDKHEIIKNDNKRYIGNNRETNILKDETKIIGNDRNLTVTNKETKKVLVSADETIGKIKNLTIGAAYNMKVGKTGTMLTSEGAISEKSMTSYTLTAPLYNMTISGAANVNVTGIMTSLSKGGFVFESEGTTFRIGPEGITMTCGPNSVLVNAAGVFVNTKPAARKGDAVGNGIVASGALGGK